MPFIKKSFLFLFFLSVLFSCNNKENIVQVTEDAFDDGKPSLIRYYKKDKELKVLHSEKKYYKNGSLQWEGAFNDGQKDGLWVFFNNDGHKKMEVTFKNGIYEGIVKGYHKNGNLRYEGFYANGKETGLWKFYDEQGAELKVETLPLH